LACSKENYTLESECLESQTTINILYYLHIFLPDILFLFLLAWTIAGIVSKRTKIYNLLSLISLAFGTAFRLLSSLGYFGWSEIYISGAT